MSAQTPGERPIGPVRGTRDWLPGEHARLAELEAVLLDRFARAGYSPMRTPVLELTELHERKSGAGIVSKLYELGSIHQSRVCLRPELTAGIVRAYTEAAEPPGLPWRVCMSAPVFRYEIPRPGRDREFQQVGVELLGASGPAADGEIIWLADWSLAEAGVSGASIRVGHVGLILEMLRRSGLPEPAQAALVEMLSDAAADGQGVRALEHGLEQLSGWLASADSPDDPPAETGDGPGVDRLFRTLVPVVTGRRSSREIVSRLRRKWDLGHSLLGVLDRVRARVHDLAELEGAPSEVLERLAKDYVTEAPESVSALRALVDALAAYSIDLDRIQLDLGFGRGIGFYSQMVFAIDAPTAEGPVEVCGGGRYDGLARVLGSDRDDRGVGFAIGLERLHRVLDPAMIHSKAAPAPTGSLLLALGPDAVSHAIRLATYLRSKEGRAILETTRSLDESLVWADRLGLARVIVVSASGDDPMGSLVQHDRVSGSTMETSAYALRQLVREEGGGKRR
jgi:histidyl-tRNA synthetase